MERPMSLSRRSFLAGLAATPIIAACGGDDEEAATTTTTTRRRPSTTTTTEATTTTPPPPPVAPLLGQIWTGDPAILARPALVVKIDNAPAARPQFGLSQADLVYEERVEGSVTRLATVFHSTDADPVGPIRSFRTTDLDIVANLNFPLFAWSGANAAFAALARSGPLNDVGYDVASSAYYRERSRRAPHNLLSTTPRLYSLHAGNGPPPQLFAYRPDGTPPVGGRQVADVRITWGGGAGESPVNWATDPASGTFFRFQRDTPHVDSNGIQVNAANVVIQFVTYVNSGARDVSGSPVPEAELVGSGPVWVLTGGQLIEGTWTRPDGASITSYTDAAGQPIGLTPGRTWVELPMAGAAAVLR
jgi:hypothetical protein